MRAAALNTCSPAAARLECRRPFTPQCCLPGLNQPISQQPTQSQVPKNARATPRYLLKIQTEVDAMQQLGGSLDAVFLQARPAGGKQAALCCDAQPEGGRCAVMCCCCARCGASVCGPLA